MMRTLSYSFCIALMLSVGATGVAAANANFIGSLTCTLSGGQGFVFGRTRDLSCIFEPFEGGANQGYKGTITRFGKPLGAAQSKVVMVWSVFSSKPVHARPLISGRYTGIVGDAEASRPPTGLDGLIGGIDNQYTLQPVRNQPNANVNFAVAIGAIVLTSVSPRA